MRDDFVMTKRLARDVCEYVVQFDGKNNQHNDRTKICVVGNVTEMTEAMTKEQEANGAEADSLGISVWLIG